jgi:hypothetical protein
MERSDEEEYCNQLSLEIRACTSNATNNYHCLMIDNICDMLLPRLVLIATPVKTSVEEEANNSRTI